MSGFVAPADATDATITNDGWWPDIDPAKARDILRLDGTVTDPRLADALINAVGSVNAELAEWKVTQVALGIETLADVEAPQVGGDSLYVALYQRAVRCTAGAELVERFRTFDLTDSGQKKAEEQTPTIDELRRDARWAIRDILGQARSTVELI